MADKKISALTSLVQADIATATDVLPIVDTSATETKKATPAAIVGAAAAAGLTNVDINSGAIDGTTVGASSASSGAFTTLSASGSVTLSSGTANGVLYLNGSKVATSGSGLTYNGSTLATTGALTVDGNATLGNASTDAVTVSGYMGVGGAGNAGQGLRLTSNALTGTSQYGAFLVPVGTSSGTTAVYGLAIAAGTAASAYTANLVRQIYTGDAVKGAGSTITSLQGIYVDDLTAGTNNYGITSAVSSGANKWNIYSSGTANNYFAGNVGIGTSSPARKLDIYDATAPTFALHNSTSGTGSTDGFLMFTLGSDVTFVNYESGYMAFSTSGTERARITAGGDVGIGTSSPGQKLEVAGTIKSTAANGLLLQNSTSTGANYIRMVDSVQSSYFGQEDSAGSTFGLTAYSTFIYGNAAYPMIFATNGAERCRIDASGNLGIGTSSPAYKLDVAGTGNASLFRINNATTGKAGMVFANNGTTAGLVALSGLFEGDSSTDISLIGESGVGIRFYTNGSAVEKAVIDTSGNLGLGVTPSAWWSAIKPLQMSGNGFVGSASNYTYLGANFFYNSSANPVYVASAAASLFEQGAGAFKWYQAASGTAGNAISFTQPMTLDASGNLALGGTSNKVTGLSGSGTGFTVQATTAPTIGVWDTSDASYYLQLGQIEANSYLWNIGNGFLSFGTNNTERARITAGGDLLVGTTTTTSRFVSYRGDAGFNGFFDSPSGAGSGVYAIGTSLASTSNNANCAHLRCTTQGVATWELQGNGTSTFSSDERLKKNIQTARNGYLDDVEKLRVVKYNWHTDDDLTAKELGLIAQEVEQVFPGLVVEDSVPLGDVQNPKAIKTSVLPYILLKAIQELSAKNDALEARLAALEAK